MGLTKKKSVVKDELKEVYEPTDDMISECKRELVQEAKEKAARGFLGLMHPMFMMQRLCPMQIKLKNKRSIFPRQPAPHNGPGILGPPLQLNGLSFPIRGELMR